RSRRALRGDTVRPGVARGPRPRRRTLARGARELHGRGRRAHVFPAAGNRCKARVMTEAGVPDEMSGAARGDGWRARRGGAAARRRLRAGGTGTLAVRRGLPGGQYRPLPDADVARIYDTALDVLERIGIGDPTPAILHYALPAGAVLDERGRLRFPRALVEDLIGRSAKGYVLHAPDPALDIEVKGSDVLFTTSGESVRILDYETQRFRPTTLVDLYDAARLADQLEHIDCFGQPFIATDLGDDLYVHHMNTAYAVLAGTRKPFA